MSANYNTHESRTTRTGSSHHHASFSSSSASTAPPPYHGARLPPYDTHDSLRPSRVATSRLPSTRPIQYDPIPIQVLQPRFFQQQQHQQHHQQTHRSATTAASSRMSPVIPVPFPPSPATSPEPERQHAQMQAFAGFLRRTKTSRSAGSTLHPLLGMKPPPLVFDVRFPDTRLEISRQWADALSPDLDAATNSRATFLRIVFEDAPWTIDVCGEAGRPVTPADVFRCLYHGLAQPMTNTEWSLADDTRRRAIVKANARRRGVKALADIRRVDWLGKRTLFSTMRPCTSSSVTERRWLATDGYQGETWTVQFEEPHSQ